MSSRSAKIVELARKQMDGFNNKETLSDHVSNNNTLVENSNFNNEFISIETYMDHTVPFELKNIEFLETEHVKDLEVENSGKICVLQNVIFSNAENKIILPEILSECASTTLETEIENNDKSVNNVQDVEFIIQQEQITTDCSLTSLENMFHENDNNNDIQKLVNVHDINLHKDVEEGTSEKICILQNITLCKADDDVSDRNDDNDQLYEPESDDNSATDSDSNSRLNDDLFNHNVRRGRPSKGRKRKYESQDRSTRKLLKNSNKPYISAKGKPIAAKDFIDYKCKCPKKCYEKLTIEDRKEEFAKFWELADYTAQNGYITSCVKEQSIKRRYATQGESKRQFSREYYIKKVQVCRYMYAETFGLSTKRINTALVKLRSSSFVDKRGKHDSHRKMDEEIYDSIIKQIEKLPKYKSHYCRASTAGERQYLSSELNLRKIYELYKTEHPHFKVSLSQYKRLFYNNFNLHFKPRKTDTCNFCDNINAKLKNEILDDKIMELKQSLEEHQSLANVARSKMKIDMDESKSIKNVETLTFDLEKTLPLPRLTTNIIFYKRQLWVYNLGIHSAKENKGNCMVWVEGEAGRGAQEVGSCLKKYICLKVGSDIEELRLWSDSCGGQNRNIKLVLMLRHILSIHPSLKKITLKFLVSGHSFLPNDADFSDIEKALKYQQRIYTPEEYINVMKSCRKNKLNTHRMHKNDFFGTSNLEKNITNRKVDMTGKKINWLKLKQIKLERNEPTTLYTKEDYDESTPYDKIDIPKKKMRRSGGTREDTLISLWPQGNAISELKLNDLKSIYHLIPNDALHFYKNLKADNTIQEDLEGFNGSLDFDIEEN